MSFISEFNEWFRTTNGAHTSRTAAAFKMIHSTKSIDKESVKLLVALLGEHTTRLRNTRIPSTPCLWLRAVMFDILDLIWEQGKAPYLRS